MKRRSSHRYAAIILLVVSFVTTTSAVDFPPLEKVLLPVAVAGELPGAFGSRWATRVAFTNTSLTDVAIDGIALPSGCNFDPCIRPTPRLRPGATIYPELVIVDPRVPAVFIYVEQGRASDVVIQLRAQDVSRQSLTWGTEIPAVRQSDAFTGAISLVDVPTDSRFRVLLRVYDMDSNPSTSVSVRIYRCDTQASNPDTAVADALVVSRSLSLSVQPGGVNAPSLVQLELGALPELVGSERVRIEVVPELPQQRLWAFVSVTNNETQHFTTITPKR